MLSAPPNRLHWVQVRDALTDPCPWRRGRLLALEGTRAVVRADTGEERVLTCHPADAVQRSLAGAVEDPAGGLTVLWQVRRRMLAVPVASACPDGAGMIEITRHCVITEDRRQFGVMAEDGTWEVRLFRAEDDVGLAELAAEALLKAEEEAARAATRPDRSVLFPRIRSRWMRGDA